MRVQENIISPRVGSSVIGGIHDHISGAYLLTHGDRILPKNLVMEILGSIGWVGDLPEEVQENGMVGYRGADVFSLIVPAGINLQYTSRSGDEVRVLGGDVRGTIDKRGIGAEYLGGRLGSGSEGFRSIIDAIVHTPVSYTHLPLPTILLV